MNKDISPSLMGIYPAKIFRSTASAKNVAFGCIVKKLVIV